MLDYVTQVSWSPYIAGAGIGILHKGEFSTKTLPQLLQVNEWLVIIPVVALVAGFLLLLEYLGL